MVAQPLPPPAQNQPFVDARGHLTLPAFNFLLKAWQRTGGMGDKVDAAHVLASNAVAQGTEVVAAGGVQGGGPLGGNVGLTLYVAVTTVADLPAGTGIADGDLAYAIDGCKPGESSGAGTGVPVFWSAGAWVSMCSGAAVTA